MAAGDKSWQVRVGSRGNPAGSDPISEAVRANLAASQQRDMERKSEIADLEHQERKSDLEAKIAQKEKERKGENVMAEELKEERAERKVAEKALKDAQLENVKIELQGDIKRLAEAAERKGESADFTKAFEKLTDTAKLLGYTPPSVLEKKTFAEQLKEALDIAQQFGYAKGDGSQVTLQMKKMDTDVQLQLAKMEDDRLQRKQEWDLRLKQFDEDKQNKKDEIEAKIAVERERNTLLSNLITELKEFGSQVMGKPSGQVAAPQVIDAGEGESGDISCPSCSSVIPIGSTDAKATCPGCGAAYPVRRIPKPPEPAAGGEK